MSTTQQIIAFIRKNIPDVKAIYSFGSYGTPLQRQDSDIDLAILPTQKIDPVKRWELAQEIARLLQRDVDLIDLLQASTVLRFEIINTGQQIYCSDKTACDLFENYVFSSYLRFNEERKELLADIRQRGQVL